MGVTKGMLRALAGYLAAVAVTYVTAVIHQTQSVVANLHDMGVAVSLGERVGAAVHDLAGMVATFLPSFLLSGFMYAIANMPVPIQIATHAIPARYFVTLLKGIYLKGVGLEVLWLEAALLALFGAAMVALANLRFEKRLP